MKKEITEKVIFDSLNTLYTDNDLNGMSAFLSIYYELNKDYVFCHQQKKSGHSFIVYKKGQGRHLEVLEKWTDNIDKYVDLKDMAEAIYSKLDNMPDEWNYIRHFIEYLKGMENDPVCPMRG